MQTIYTYTPIYTQFSLRGIALMLCKEIAKKNVLVEKMFPWDSQCIHFYIAYAWNFCILGYPLYAMLELEWVQAADFGCQPITGYFVRAMVVAGMPSYHRRDAGELMHILLQRGKNCAFSSAIVPIRTCVPQASSLDYIQWYRSSAQYLIAPESPLFRKIIAYQRYCVKVAIDLLGRFSWPTLPARPRHKLIMHKLSTMRKVSERCDVTN